MKSAKQAVREVLGLLDDIDGALHDAISAMAMEDIPTAVAYLGVIENSAARASDILKPEEKAT